jgi:hypothetical protein
MAAGNWVVYDEFKLALGNKLVDLDTDTIKVALFLSTSNAGSASLATAQYATLTNQHANANGYTTGGVTVASTYADAAGTETFDIADPSWTASGGSIAARFAVIYSDTATNKDLIAYCLLDSTPADVTVTTGNTLAIQINASGVWTLT